MKHCFHSCAFTSAMCNCERQRLMTPLILSESIVEKRLQLRLSAARIIRVREESVTVDNVNQLSEDDCRIIPAGITKDMRLRLTREKLLSFIRNRTRNGARIGAPT